MTSLWLRHARTLSPCLGPACHGRFSFIKPQLFCRSIPLSALVRRPYATEKTNSAADAQDLARRLEGTDVHDVTKHLSKEAKMRLVVALKTDVDFELLDEATPHPHEISSAPPITRTQYVKLVIRAGAPFVVFGFIDNTIMIIAGETLNAAFGATLGLSTMAAAAIGNMFSDVVGTGFGGMIQALADKLRVPNPHLTPAQHHVPHVIAVKNASCVFGIMVGCFLGMFPLLFTSG